MTVAYLPDSVPFPEPPLDARAFWTHCANKRLMFQACAACGKARHPPTPLCPHCQSAEQSWIEAPSEGRVFTYTVVHHPSHDSVAGALPYAVVLVEFPELGGVRLVSNLVDPGAGEIAIGMAVELVWEPHPEAIWLPRFKPKR